MTATRTTCSSRGTRLLEHARFCQACGSPNAPSEVAAEYQQVTVLFADEAAQEEI